VIWFYLATAVGMVVVYAITRRMKERAQQIGTVILAALLGISVVAFVYRECFQDKEQLERTGRLLRPSLRPDPYTPTAR
jgi:hypothetical protein